LWPRRPAGTIAQAVSNVTVISIEINIFFILPPSLRRLMLPKLMVAASHLFKHRTFWGEGPNGYTGFRH
jgi:hypothetical protein